MADENRISVSEERVEKRKVDDFSALYNLDSSARNLTETTGRSLIHKIQFITTNNSFY